MTPYYDDGTCVIYHGDCREVMASLIFDVIVTDPPYGIGLDTDYSGLAGSTRSYRPIHGDATAFAPGDFTAWPVAFFGADHFAHLLPAGGTFHVWDKRVDANPNMFSDFETWWTSWPSGPSRIFRYQSVAGVHPGSPTTRWISHPTVKPVPVMRNVIGSAPDGVVLDPFMGSGTTLRAAKDLGRTSIGIEIEERYCEIAAKRLGQEVLDFGGTA